MGKKLNLLGQRIGKLTIIEERPSQRYACGKSHRQYLCQCDCGNQTVITVENLRSGNTKSCGCYRREDTARRKTIHGHTRRGKRSSTYDRWSHMIQRCENHKNKEYRWYGARGIKVCERWHEFSNFLADMGEAPDNLTLDRIDPNGNYEPNNCRWITQYEQTNNTRRNVVISSDIGELTMSQFCRAKNISYDRFKKLYRKGGLPLVEIVQMLQDS